MSGNYYSTVLANGKKLVVYSGSEEYKLQAVRKLMDNWTSGKGSEQASVMIVSGDATDIWTKREKVELHNQYGLPVIVAKPTIKTMTNGDLGTNLGRYIFKHRFSKPPRVVIFKNLPLGELHRDAKAVFGTILEHNSYIDMLVLMEPTLVSVE